MKRIIVLFLVLIVVGCSASNGSDFENQGKHKLSTINYKILHQELDGISFSIRTQEEVEGMLEPLLEGVFLENKMIQGASYQEGMKLEDFRTFLLQYYTEEIANETCELIVYKSQRGYGTEYSGMFYYDIETDIFFLEESNYLEVLPEDPRIEIFKISLQTEDRIEIIGHPNWKLKSSNSWSTDRGFLVITLEKEGDRWYLGDLVLTRRTINEANREYANY